MYILACARARARSPHCGSRALISSCSRTAWDSSYVYIYIYIYTSISIYLSLSLYIYIYIYICISLSLSIYIYIHICIQTPRRPARGPARRHPAARRAPTNSYYGQFSKFQTLFFAAQTLAI